MSWPAAVLWILMIGAILSRGPNLLYLMLIAGAFGSLQMLPFNGGVNLLPQSACAALFVGKAMVQRGNIMRGIESALDSQRMILFSAFVGYAVFGAVILPRAFLGLFEVVPISAPISGTDILRPGSGNITQSCYIMLSYGTAVTLSVVGHSAAMRMHYRRALLWAAYVLVLSGVVDLVTYTLHIGAVLEPFRTATYSFLVDVESEGSKRVVGLMPEASTFGTACVGLMASLVFLRPFYKKGPEHLLVLAAIALLGMMTILSTSSTGVVGLGVLSLVYAADLVYRVFDPYNSRRAELNLEFVTLFLALFAVFAGIIIKPNLLDPVYTMIDGLIFEKTKSASYAERTMWTRIGWQAFLDTGGMGAGLGSIRVSNWAVSILGSTGLFGALLMFGFIAQQLLTMPRGARKEAAVFATALKLSLLPTLAMYLVVATIPDIGVGVATVLGLIAASHTPDTLPGSSATSRPAPANGPA
ncbi:hypothetical protein FV242_26025 [Methylobacterium sp. WL64]|uniref:hypothetical protein n=1 Tax=Methylobacterium sp. WL64 TaxID=2603894 RepID=UPI0011C7ABB7|nr:hypothetical protein [Methylobacterium sp. WL64]TXM99294.1 hypothetical protein FV242_26025 [Methylobacterium sp. WL64]